MGWYDLAQDKKGVQQRNPVLRWGIPQRKRHPDTIAQRKCVYYEKGRGGNCDSKSHKPGRGFCKRDCSSNHKRACPKPVSKIVSPWIPQGHL